MAELGCGTTNSAWHALQRTDWPARLAAHESTTPHFLQRNLRVSDELPDMTNVRR